MDDSPGKQISENVPRMYRVAHRLLGDADQAHDVVQDACLKALAKAESFDGRSKLVTWLHRITVNCAKDALRSGSRQAAAHDAMRRRREPCLASESPDEQAARREMSELAWAMLDDLPRECRSAFALTQLDGYSYEEAAEIEGQPRGTIGSRVFRAKRILLQRMKARIDGRANS